MFIILLFQSVYTLRPDNFLCGLRLYYAQESYFLLDQHTENTMPYILTSKSPHFALDIQQNYQSALAMNNNSYFLINFPDVYIFIGNASDLQWLQIQEFKVKQNQTKVDVLIYNDYYAYYVDKGDQGGHLLISKENLKREFSFGKTDAIDKFLKPEFIYIITWSSQGDVIMILKRFVQFITESEGIDYCQQKTLSISLDQIKCNLDLNFDQLTFHTPDLYHPPIHYHLGNQTINGSLSNHYFTKNYPGLQVFVAQNLNDTLEIKIPIKNMQTQQNAVESPLSGLIITVQQENRGFIHIFIFESDEGIIINYKEDENLAYITIGQTDQKIFVFSFVTSSFTNFPQIDIIQHVFQDCVMIIQQRNNVCEKPTKECQNLSQDYFHQFDFNLNYNQQITFKLNEETFNAPFIEMYDNLNIIVNEFNIKISSDINNREMNHGGYIGSFLRITNKNQSINSLIINEQNEELEVYYNINDNIYSHQVQNAIGRTYILVFVAQSELTDMQCLQIFREFIDHIQRIFIIEQLEQRCESQMKNFDVIPIQYKDIHKLVKQATELLQTNRQQDQLYDEQNDFEYQTNEEPDELEYLDENEQMYMMDYENQAQYLSGENPTMQLSQEQIQQYQRMMDMEQEQQFQNQYQQEQQQQQQQQSKKVEEIHYTDIEQKKRQQIHEIEQQLQKKQKNQEEKQQKQNIKKTEQKTEKVYQNLRQNKQKQQNQQQQKLQTQLPSQQEYQQTFHQRDEQKEEYYDRNDRQRKRDSYGRGDKSERRDDYYGRREDHHGRRDDNYGRRDDYYGRRDENYGRRDDYYGRRDDYYGRDDYQGRDDYYDREDTRRAPALTGQSIIVPKNPSDQELGRFFREVIGRLQTQGKD